MSCKMLDQIEKTLVFVVRRVCGRRRLMGCLAAGCLVAGCLALLLISGAYASTTVDTHNQMKRDFYTDSTGLDIGQHILDHIASYEKKHGAMDGEAWFTWTKSPKYVDENGEEHELPNEEVKKIQGFIDNWQPTTANAGNTDDPPVTPSVKPSVNPLASPFVSSPPPSPPPPIVGYEKAKQLCEQARHDSIRAELDFRVLNANYTGAVDEGATDADPEIKTLKALLEASKKKRVDALKEDAKNCGEMERLYHNGNLTQPILEQEPDCTNAASACVQARAHYAYATQIKFQNGNLNPDLLCVADLDATHEHLTSLLKQGSRAPEHQRDLFNKWWHAKEEYFICLQREKEKREKREQTSSGGNQDVVDPPLQGSAGGQHRDITTTDNQSDACEAAQNAYWDATGELQAAIYTFQQAVDDLNRALHDPKHTLSPTQSDNIFRNIDKLRKVEDKFEEPLKKNAMPLRPKQ
jgi:hypothetical protein